MHKYVKENVWGFIHGAIVAPYLGHLQNTVNELKIGSFRFEA